MNQFIEVIIPLTKTLEVETIGQNEVETNSLPSLMDFLAPYVAVLWKDWPVPMNVTALGQNSFSLNGQCPHCSVVASFMIIAGPHNDVFLVGNQTHDRLCAAMQCQSCLKYILGLVTRPRDMAFKYSYEAHYPMGKPNDTISPHVPPEISPVFAETLRCKFVKALGATVLMCRRSLQISCDREKAEGNDLFKQIDDLAAKGRITDTLRKMAHRIRLLGKQGAHGDYSDIDDTITEKDAEDAILFMSHYLQHVYVLPAKLGGA